MDKNRQELVMGALKEKGAILPCPRCQNLEFLDQDIAAVPPLIDGPPEIMACLVDRETHRIQRPIVPSSGPPSAP
jgi:hypothetical protein